jgi:lipoprotein NlpI
MLARRLILLLVFVLVLPTCAQDPRAILQQAVTDFESGRIGQSVLGFDRFVQLVPREAPYMWQRGIALYYAKRYKDCREQFESHRLVNPNDVENAAWHFLCVARMESPEKAKQALLPVGLDSRAPMSEVYRLYKGELTPDDVLKAAGSGVESQFFAHLYVALYYEVTGDAAKAREHITTASDKKYSSAGYMHMVAVVHRRLMK